MRQSLQTLLKTTLISLLAVMAGACTGGENSLEDTSEVVVEQPGDSDDTDTGSGDVDTDDPPSTDTVEPEPPDTDVPPCPTGYELVDLGTLGGEFSTALGIDNSGSIVGQAAYDSGVPPLAAFIWEPGASDPTTGTLSEFSSELPPEEFFPREIFGINDGGELIGNGTYVPDQWSGGSTRGFFWSEETGTLIDICPDSTCAPNGLNNNGVVVGLNLDNSNRGPFIWSQSKGSAILPAHPRPWMFTPHEALDINDSGTVVGELIDSQGATRAFRWNEYDGYTVLRDLDSTSQLRSTSGSINNRGQAVGSSMIADAVTGYDSSRPVLWQADGNIVDLGILEEPTYLIRGSAEAINDEGFIIGMDDDVQWSQSVAWLWCGVEPGKVALAELLSPGQAADWTIQWLGDLNNDGVIAATARHVSHANVHAVALIPTY